jgi:hypothetical protein
MVTWPHALGQNIMVVEVVAEKVLPFMLDRKQSEEGTSDKV